MSPQSHSSKSKKLSNHQKADKSHKHSRASSSASSATSHKKKKVHQEILIPQPDTGPTSQAQLTAQVQTIQAGLAMVEEKCIEVDRKMGSAAPHVSSQHWQNDFDVVDGPVIDNGFKDPAVLFGIEGVVPGETWDQGAFEADIDDTASPTVLSPASGHTYQPSMDTWSHRTTYYEPDGKPNGTSYDSYGQPPYTQPVGNASSDHPTTASGSETLQDEQAQIPRYASGVYDYTLGRWVYEGVTLDVPVNDRFQSYRY